MALFPLPFPNWKRSATAPLSAASIDVFRILFGALIAGSAVRFWSKGWIDELLVSPTYHFSYYGFEWVPRLGTTGTQIIFLTIIASALCVALGWFTRTALAALFLSFTWIELYDVSTYLNHYYLVSALCLLMLCLPMSGPWSIDGSSIEGRSSGRRVAPSFAIWALRAQVGVVYVFAGLAKLRADWLLDAEPLKTWLQARSDLPVLGPYLTLDVTAYVFAWTGAVYDLTVVAFLLWGRTRPFAYAAVVIFHLATGLLFRIGVFPLVMIALTTVFFSPDWPQRLMSCFRRFASMTSATVSSATVASTTVGSLPFASFSGSNTKNTAPHSRIAVTATAALLLFQALWPLRQLAYKGNTLWTEEGYRFSWNVMLMEKTGQVDFLIKDSATSREFLTTGRSALTPLQYKVMQTQPDLILQFSHWLVQDYARRYGLVAPQVFVDAWASLNQRPRQQLIDPRVDLSLQTDGLAGKSWILPLDPHPDKRVAKY